MNTVSLPPEDRNESSRFRDANGNALCCWCDRVATGLTGFYPDWPEPACGVHTAEHGPGSDSPFKS